MLIVDGNTLVRYVERATGHVYEMPVEGGEARRLTNTTIPKVREAAFAPDTAAAVLRYLDTDGETIVSFSGTFGTSTGELSGTFLPRNILSIAFAPGGTLASLVKTASGAELVSSQADGGKRALLYASPLTEWLLSWPATSTILLASKPSAAADGFLYALNPATKAVVALLSERPALMGLGSRDGARVAFSENVRGLPLALNILEVKSGAETALPLQTFPAEKCVWSIATSTLLYCASPSDLPNAAYPDAWYQGAAVLSDDLWLADTLSGAVILVALLEETAGIAIDVIDPFLSSDERYLFFRNKNDSTLWSLKLTDD